MDAGERRSGRSCCGWRRSSRVRARRPTRARWTTGLRARLRGTGGPDLADARPRRAALFAPRREPARPDASSTSSCAPGRTAIATAKCREDSRWRSSSATHTASTSVRSSRCCPTCCARRAARSSSRTRICWPTSRACARRWHAGTSSGLAPDRAARPALEQLVAAQRAVAGAGSRALHAARAPRRRRKALGPRTGVARACAPSAASWTYRSRSPTRSLPASSAFRTAGGTVDPGHASSVSASRPGVNFNALADASVLDAPSGTAIVNGIPVEISPA